MNLIILAAYFLDGLGYVIAGVLTVILLAAGGAIVDAMTTSAAVRAAARGVLIWAALFPLAGTLAYQMDGVFIGATWSADMRNTMLFSLVIYLLAGWLLATPLGITGWWLALLIFLLARGLSLV